MKLERSEMELSERKQALASCQMRMRSIEEEAADAKAHIQLLKEQLTNREQQSRLMHGDVSWNQIQYLIEGFTQIWDLVDRYAYT